MIFIARGISSKWKERNPGNKLEHSPMCHLWHVCITMPTLLHSTLQKICLWRKYFKTINLLNGFNKELAEGHTLLGYMKQRILQIYYIKVNTWHVYSYLPLWPLTEVIENSWEFLYRLCTTFKIDNTCFSLFYLSLLYFSSFS